MVAERCILLHFSCIRNKPNNMNLSLMAEDVRLEYLYRRLIIIETNHKENLRLKSCVMMRQITCNWKCCTHMDIIIYIKKRSVPACGKS